MLLLLLVPVAQLQIHPGFAAGTTAKHPLAEHSEILLRLYVLEAEVLNVAPAFNACCELGRRHQACSTAPGIACLLMRCTGFEAGLKVLALQGWALITNKHKPHTQTDRQASKQASKLEQLGATKTWTRELEFFDPPRQSYTPRWPSRITTPNIFSCCTTSRSKDWSDIACTFAVGGFAFSSFLSVACFLTHSCELNQMFSRNRNTMGPAHIAPSAGK
jgi:hypothetical protein